MSTLWEFLTTTLPNALGAERYTAHSLCLTADPLIMSLYVVGDGVTWLSYFVIGITLLTAKRSALLGEIRPEMRILFGLFIFLCGLSHFTMILTLFSGVYRLDVMVRVAMATVSAVTAFLVVRDVTRAER